MQFWFTGAAEVHQQCLYACKSPWQNGAQGCLDSELRCYRLELRQKKLFTM